MIFIATTFIVGNLGTSLLVIHSKSRQNINEDIEDLNNTTNQLDLIEIYTTLHPTTDCTLKVHIAHSIIKIIF